ncbi:MAG: cupin domain-containing protein [Bdellovibrionales bacterium]|nr:cupin domain-containing protein [Bdellovibrionales bacterium]
MSLSESKIASLEGPASVAACKASETAVLVIGDLILDSFIDGNVTRISPEAPVPVLSNPAEAVYAIGGAGNVAHNLHTLENRVRLVGGIGNTPEGEIDGFGQRLVEEAQRAGLSPDYFARLERTTTVKQRFLAGRQQLLRIDQEDTSPLSKVEETRVLEALERGFDGVAAIVVSDYAKGILTDTVAARISRYVAEKGVPLLADLKAFNIDKLTHLSVLKPNLKEAQELTGRTFSGNIDEIASMAEELADRFSCKIVITCGGLGIVLHDGRSTVHLKAQAKEVFDVSGAGDTVMAGLVHGEIRGLSLEDSCSFAALAAGIAVSRHGVVAVRLREVESEIVKKIVPKAWGHEEWIVNAEYCGKKLVLNEGCCCSLHYHKLKDETFYIASGKVGFQYNDLLFVLRPGDSLLIPPGTKHRFYGLEHSQIFEFSTHHLEEDSYRDEPSGTFDKTLFDAVPEYRTLNIQLQAPPGARKS